MNENESLNRGRETRDGERQPQRSLASRRTMLQRCVLVVVYSLSILYFGTRPMPSFPGDQVLCQDKLLHAVVFGGLGVLVYRCARTLWPRRTSSWVALASVGLATALGGLLELVQSYLPYRSLEFADLVADFLGAALCVAMAKRWNWERPWLHAGA